MKIKFKLFALAILLSIVACETEDFTPLVDSDSIDQEQTENPEENETPDGENEEGEESEEEMEENEEENPEDTSLDADFVFDNLEIRGGTKMEGAPPTPNEAISLDISESDKYGFQEVGFNIVMESDADIKGAYLLIKSEEGTMADSYYDINLDENSNYDKRAVRSRKKRSLTKKEDESYLEIGFTPDVAPGEFCYEICVYDASGSISTPQEFCVTIKDWGGNEEVIGIWELTKRYKDVAPNELLIIDYLCESVEHSTTSCSGVDLELIRSAEYCLQYGKKIDFDEDGTYYLSYDYFSEDKVTDLKTYDGELFDVDTFIASCGYNPIFNTTIFETSYSIGYWSYIEEEDRFVLVPKEVDYLFEVNDSVEDEYHHEEAYVFEGSGGYNGTLKLVEDELVLYSFEEQTFHFKKQ